MSITVEELLAREEIRQAILRHFRAVDRVDAALERDAFWEDGQFVGGPVAGPMTEAIPVLYEQLLPGFFESTCHYISNLLVTVDGSSGFVEAYGVGYQVIANRPDALEAVLGAEAPKENAPDVSRRYELLIGVRYAIRVECREGVWKIATMEPVVDWARVRPYVGIPNGGLPAAIAGRGRRDRADPTYFGRQWKP